MSTRKETNKQVIIHSDKSGKTDVWEKNSAGVTTKEGHRTHYHKSGNVVDHFGKIISKTKI